MMIARMFLVFFGITFGYVIGVLMASEIAGPVIRYWGFRIRSRLGRAMVRDGLVVYMPPNR